MWLAQRAGIEGPDAIEAVESGLTLLWSDEPVAPPEPPPALVPEPVPDAPTGPMPLVESVPPPSSGPPAQRSPAAPLPPRKPFPSPQSKRQVKAKPPSEGSNRRLLALLAIGAVIIVLLIVLTSGGSDDTSGGGTPPVASTTTKGSDKPTKGSDNPTKGSDNPTSASVSMQMLPGVKSSGMIEVTMGGDPAAPELDMKLQGLPDPKGEYRAWLYKSVIDSRSLGRARKGDGEIIATLPKGWQNYPFIDVSIQKPGSIAHSGESVFAHLH